MFLRGFAGLLTLQESRKRFLANWPLLVRISRAQTFHIIPNEVNSNAYITAPKEDPSITQAAIDPIAYMKDFCALVKILRNDRRDFKTLARLDLMLVKTHLLDSAAQVFVINGLCRLNKLIRAKAVLRNLRTNGIVPDFFLYSLVYYCLVRDGRIKDVESVWEEICGNGLSCVIDVFAFVVHLCKFGEALEAEKVFSRVLVGGGSLEQQSYIALIGALCRKNEGILASKVLRHMVNNGFQPDRLTYLTLFQCFCRIGNVYEADIILRNLILSDYKLDISVYGSFIYGLCKSGKLREAKKLFHKLIKRDHPVAVSSLKQGRRAIFQVNSGVAVPEIIMYETYCRSLCSIGCLEEAGLLVKEMMRMRTVPEICVHNSFIRSLIRKGEIDKAVIFSENVKMKGFVSSQEIVIPLILGFCEIGRVDDAYRLLHEIINSGFVPTASICNSLLLSYCQARRLCDAMRLFERMRDGSFCRADVSTYTIIVTGLCDNGNVPKALSLFQEMIKNKMPVNFTLSSTIIRGLCVIGELEEAHRHLNKMIENGYLVSFVGWEFLFDSMTVASQNSLSLTDSK